MEKPEGLTDSHHGRRKSSSIVLELPRPVAPPSDTTLTVEQHVAVEITRLIATGVLEPGARLPLRQLADHFQVSTTPVRAALIQLARDRLVDYRTHGGVRVAEMSLEEFEEVWTMRVGLEWWLTRRGVESVTDSDLPQLDALFDTLREAALQRTEWPNYVARSWDYRRHLYALGHRPQILAALDVTYARSARYSRLMLVDTLRIDHAFATMVHLHEAMHRRDAQGAQQVLRLGMEWTMDHALKQFAQEPGFRIVGS